MPPIEMPGVVSITTAGHTYTLTSTTATPTTLVPLNSNGTNPKIVRVIADHVCNIKFSTAQTTSVTEQDILLTPNGGADYFNVTGQPFFSARLSTASATTTYLNITPVETG